MNRGLFLAMAFGALALWGLVFSLSGSSDALAPWVFSPAPQQAAPLPVEDQQDVRTIAFDGRDLWILTLAGRLWRANEASEQVVEVPLPGPVVGLCGAGGQITAVSEAGDHQTWLLYRLAKGAREPLQVDKSPHEHFAGLACDQSASILVSSERLLLSEQEKTRSIALQGDIPLRGQNSVLATRQAVWVGSNIGEFGGGLRRIDRETGKVEVISRNLTGAICGSPLDTDCDAVTAVAQKASKPDCVLATIGLVHMSSHGRLIEVCGRDPRRVMLHPCPEQAKQQRQLLGDDEPACSAAMFGLAQKGRRLVVVTNLGLMDVAANGSHVVEPLPRFETYGPFRLSFQDPDFVLAMTGANGRYSLSGQTPLITTRQPN